MNCQEIETIVRALVNGIDMGLGTAIAETSRATSGEDANRAALRGLKGVRSQIKEIKKLLDKTDSTRVQ